MKALFILMFFIFCQPSSSQEISLQAMSHDLGLKGAVHAPEGITISPSGLIYTTSMKAGKVFVAQAPNFKPREIIDLSLLKGWQAGKKPKVLGILAENDNQLWIALTDVWGGCLYSLKKGTHFVAKPAFCRAGDLNGLIIDKSRGRLYASSREPGLGTAGMIISLSLKDLKAAVKKSQVIEYEPEIHNLLKTDMPNGLALSKDNKELFFVQTMKDRVLSIDLTTKKIRIVFKSNESGWLDGLIYLADKQLYGVVDSKLGKLHFFKHNGSKVQSIKLLNPEGQSTGLASIARDGDRIYLTDLWKGSLFAKSVEEITGSDSQMTYHNRIYTFSIDELLEFR